MKKKLLSLILAGSVAVSMTAVAAVSASATLMPDGTYEPGKDPETGLDIATKRVYFTMPDSWKNSFTDTAGCYWWAGTDACGAVDGSGGSLAWPGYKAKYDASLEEQGVKTLYYLDVPTDVPTVVWNNYVDGGMDESAPQYAAATQCVNSACEYMSDGDVELYDNQDGFWDEMEDSYNGDKAALGDFADNFFESDYGIAFTMDNMIWVPDLTHTDTAISGKVTYYGDWYFYYGDGTYGSYPTKEEAQEKGTFGDLSVAVDPTSPATPDEPTTVPTTTDPSASEISTTPTSSNNDATSAVGASATADSAKSTTSDNSSVQTGTASLAVILLVVLSGAGSVVYFTRRRNSK